MKSEVSILQVSPTGYSKKSVIGGGEKYVLYADQALRRASAAKQLPVQTAILVLDGEAGTASSGQGGNCQYMPGRAWDPLSLDAADLTARLRPFDVVYVHQCLCDVGLFVAAHAKLLGKTVFGVDSGAGEYQLIKTNPDIARIYRGFHAHSRFAQNSFSEFDVPVHLVYGPVDSDGYVCPPPGKRDPQMVLAVGRLLPHKGFEKIIAALPPALALTIAGTPYDDAYVTLLQEKSAGKKVTFRKDLSDAELLALIQRAGLFVHASAHFDYRGHYHPKPELLGLAPLEALSTGLRTLVSDAGSLPELAELPGCWCFRNSAELAELLRAYAAGKLENPASEEMHAAVTERYGLLQFGEKLLQVMGAC
jgi:glycosyltransferase involved in cell wall biosynthesis